MTTTHDDNATIWRDLADQLTPEQVARIERQEAQALNSIRAGRNVYESPEDVARCFLNEARMEAKGNLTDAMIGLPIPAGAEEVDHWEDDGAGTWTRFVHGQHRSIRGYDATVYLDGVQTRDGAVSWSLYVHVEDREPMTADRVRDLAAKLSGAADELERLA